jgi:hypothetical protein
MDIIVYSNTYEEHIKHLDAVLGKLRTACLTISTDKCNFVSKKSNFTMEECGSNGKIKGQFNFKSIKVYKEAIDKI